MAILVTMRKTAEDDVSATYDFGFGERFDRSLTFDKAQRASVPADGREDTAFHAAAAKVARAWRDEGRLPDVLVHAA